MNKKKEFPDYETHKALKEIGFDNTYCEIAVPCDGSNYFPPLKKL